MKKHLYTFFKYGACLFLLFLAVSLIQQTSGGVFLKWGLLEAKVLETTDVLDVDTVIFDKANPSIQAIMAVQKRHTDSLMAETGIVGTAIGLSGDVRPALFVFVKSFAIAREAFIPENIEGVKVIVKITGDIKALKPPAGKGPGGKEDKVDPTSRFERPVPIGVSTGHPDITAGTIGCRVTDGTNVYALSNNHVYANENLAAKGDNVLQPGTFDGGIDPTDAIGTLYYFEDIDFSGGVNTIDAAIALSTTDRLGNATPSDGYGIPNKMTAEASIGQRVMKYGRTTSQTKGRVWAINATVNVSYDTDVARFVDQIIITPGTFSAGGDSGSLIVVQKGKDARKPIGLLFAGSNTITVANPIDAVLDRFNVTIDGE